MASPEQRRANRSNAQRSSGPKSAAGKQRASRNAVRHGLSVPLPPAAMAPMQNGVADLLEKDGLERSAALDLAEKIIDWERTRAHDRLRFLKEFDPQNAPPPPRRRLVDDYPEFKGPRLLTFVGLLLERQNEPVYSQRHQALDDQMVEILVRERIRQQASYERYLRRASNQLFKALRSVI